MRIWKIVYCNKCKEAKEVVLSTNAEYSGDSETIKKLTIMKWCECLYPA